MTWLKRKPTSKLKFVKKVNSSGDAVGYSVYHSKRAKYNLVQGQWHKVGLRIRKITKKKFKPLYFAYTKGRKKRINFKNKTTAFKSKYKSLWVRKKDPHITNVTRIFKVKRRK